MVEVFFPPQFRPISDDGCAIFRHDLVDYSIFYAPGCLCVVETAQADAFCNTLGPLIIQRQEHWGKRLWDHAERAQQDLAQRETAPFAPECLMLYLHNACNLNCVYCYTNPARAPTVAMNPQAVAHAAELVAMNCRRQQKPLTVVFHGGGEPTLYLHQLAEMLLVVEATAHACQVELFRYIATNGVLTAEKASFLARNFDLVGLSCDGMAAIQDTQRPRYSGGATSAAVERTAALLHETDCPFHIRATITAATLSQQEAIAAYICERLVPEAIHFEPVYLGGKSQVGLKEDQAELFVAHFLAAQDLARRYGIPLTTSGSRPEELHGPFCNVFRQVLNLIPPGIATTCFKTTSPVQAEAYGGVVGRYNAQNDCYELDHACIMAIRRRLNRLAVSCQTCFNRYHCARLCPDGCPLEEVDNLEVNSASGFRCRVQKTLTYTRLHQAADQLWNAAIRDASGGEPTVYGTTTF